MLIREIALKAKDSRNGARPDKMKDLFASREIERYRIFGRTKFVRPSHIKIVETQRCVSLPRY